MLLVKAVQSVHYSLVVVELVQVVTQAYLTMFHTLVHQVVVVVVTTQAVHRRQSMRYLVTQVATHLVSRVVVVVVLEVLVARQLLVRVTM
jgi:hypothetical protein